MLQRYLLIPLDIFQENLQNKDRGPENLLEAWLTFIGSDRPEDIMRVIDIYPEFQELYGEVFEFRNQKRELISMYSKALSILDANTVEYMVEEQKKEIRKLKKELRKERQDSAKKLEYERELSAKEKKLLEEEIARLNAILKEKEKATL